MEHQIKEQFMKHTYSSP